MGNNMHMIIEKGKWSTYTPKMRHWVEGRKKDKKRKRKIIDVIND